MEKFGKFGTIYSLSEGDPLKFSAVMDLTMYEVNLTFKMRSELRKFNQRYEKLIMQEHERKHKK